MTIPPISLSIHRPARPACNLSLMQSPRSAVNRLVFCVDCRAGGYYADVVDNGKPLTPGIRHDQRTFEAMLHAMGTEAE